MSCSYRVSRLWCHRRVSPGKDCLTHRGLNKIAAISQTTFFNGFSRKESIMYWLICHCSLSRGMVPNRWQTVTCTNFVNTWSLIYVIPPFVMREIIILFSLRSLRLCHYSTDTWGSMASQTTGNSTAVYMYIYIYIACISNYTHINGWHVIVK